MSVSSDPLKNKKLYFHGEEKENHHPDVVFNGNPAIESSYQKHLGIFLNSKFEFDEHIEGIPDKTSKSNWSYSPALIFFTARSSIIYKYFVIT